MKFARAIIPATLLMLSSCGGGSDVKSSSNDNTAIRAGVDTVKVDTRKLAPPMVSYAPEISDSTTATLVRSALQLKFKDDLTKGVIDSASRKFAFFAFDLNEDGKREILVALRGMYFCGSGGCSPLLLDDQGKSITQFSVSEYPIVVDNARTKGWRDLFIESNGKFHVLKFDGKKYPSNPSVQPVLNLLPGDGLPRLLDLDHEAYPWFSF